MPLPVVLPIVLYHGARRWTAATCMQGLFDPDLVAVPEIAAYIPHASFILDDVGRLTDEELHNRALGLLPTLTLWALRDARRPGQIAKSLESFGALIRQLFLADSGGEALLSIFRYLSVVVPDLSPDTLFATIEPVPTHRKEQFMTTLAERWRSEGRVEGEAKGRVEGEAKGRVEGAREVLCRLLSLKFGELPRAARQRIEHATEEQILRWSAGVLDADSLEAALTH